MRTIARLFVKSPFSPLQNHMKKVSLCFKKLSEIFDNLQSPAEAQEARVKALSKLEYEADLTKNDIRNHLPKSLFLPIQREQFLDILSIQDSLADTAEDVGHLLILHTEGSLDFLDQLKPFYEKSIEAFWSVRNIIKEIDDLLESTFGGIEAERIKEMAEHNSYIEYQSDKTKHQLLKHLFQMQSLPPPTFYLYVSLIEKINHISHIAEKLANRIRMILELK